MKGSYLGNEFNQDEIEKELKLIGANYNKYNYSNIIEKTSQYLSEDKAIGWFQGRMEFGPRALGSRSIIANPQSGNMQKNLKLKSHLSVNLTIRIQLIFLKKLKETLK